MARSREKVTVFPQPIGLAATFNPEALHKAAGMIADEGRAIGPSAPRCQHVRFRRVALEPGERRTLTFRLSTRDLAYVKRLERAIRRGDIVWNGVPYTVESEAMNRALFEGGLALSARLDKRYHRHTVAAKMTDVPGHTRSIIAPLARGGIRFLHVGVNPACTVPGVPPSSAAGATPRATKSSSPTSRTTAPCASGAPQPSSSTWANPVASTTPPTTPTRAGGIHFNLSNNLWGTNFSMWNEGSLTYRFTIEWLPGK